MAALGNVGDSGIEADYGSAVSGQRSAMHGAEACQCPIDVSGLRKTLDYIVREE